MNILVYDFEVFKFDWMIVIINYDTKEKTIIINDMDTLTNFYELHKEDVWVGYNSRNYDQFILKGILKGLDPYLINNEIIINDRKGYHVVPNSDEYPLNNFDISNAFRGLKELEGFMGSTIKESSVPFNIDRKLTEEELEDVLKYCTHDVEQTIEVFKNRREEFDSQLALINAFSLPMTMFNKTKAQLSALVLGSNRQERGRDEFNLSFPDTLQISDKYQPIIDWYKDEKNKDYTKKLFTHVAGVPHIFAWGGIHGAIDNYVGEGIILCCDVASLYPSLMIEYGYISRNVTEPQKYKEIRDTRLRLKKEKNPMQLPYKIVLNSTYGAMKDHHNDLYDPLMANNVCIAGQVLLLDLIEKIEPYCELIQSNTDGLFLKVDDMETVEKIKEVSKLWEKRTRLDLEWDIYNKIFQKDVNNYIIINEKGKYKSKGSYVKELNNIDYDLPIINSALINYFIYNKPLEDTINECNALREFQKIVKVSRLYMYALHGDTRVYEKVLRVFASTDENAQGVFKVKNKEKNPEKIASTPEKCFIYNDNVIDVNIPEYLDKQYYIDVANKRLADFIDVKNCKVSKIPSDIKFINCEVKEELLQFYEKDFPNFIDFLVDLTDNSSANTRQIEIMIKLNYFKKYGRNKKLLEIFEVFSNGKNKYSSSYKEKTKNIRLEYLYNYEKLIEDLAFPLMEQMKFDIEFTGKLTTTYPVDKGTCFIVDLDLKNSPKALIYGLSSGTLTEIKIQKAHYNKLPFKKGDVVQFLKLTKKPKVKYMGTNENNKPVFEKIENEFDLWSEEYRVVNYEKI
jgi:hypothetical protein